MECLHVFGTVLARKIVRRDEGEKKQSPLRTRVMHARASGATYFYDGRARAHARYRERLRGIFCLRRIRPLTKPDDALGTESQARLQ